jgi:uncharacterized protein (TIGR00251 family)
VSELDAQLRGSAVRFTVRVQPRASRNEIAGLYGSALKIRLTAPPAEGMANEALIDFLSETLKTVRRNVCIVSGHNSRTKVVEVIDANLETIHGLAE